MANLARQNVDIAGGLLIQGSTDVNIEGKGVVRVGDQVANHGSHSGVTMIQGSSKVFVNGKAVCRQGDLASCGHNVSSGSAIVSVG